MLARSSGATPARMASNRAGSDRWAASPAWITAPQGIAPSGVPAPASRMITRPRSGREEEAGADLLHLGGRGDHQRAGLAVVQDEAGLVGQKGGVDGNADRPQIEEGVIESRPLGPVLREDRNPVPLPDPQGFEAQGQGADRRDEVLRGDVVPGPARLEPEEIRPPEMAVQVGQDVAEGPDLHSALLPAATCRTGIRS